MSANDDLPRSWHFNADPGSGLTASITVGALAAVSHVLTNVHAQIACAANVAVAASPVVKVTIGLVTYTIGYLPLAAGTSVAGSFSASVEEDWSGKILAPINTAMTVAFSGGGSQCFEVLDIQGYSI